MSADPNRIQAVFLVAVEATDPAGRAEVLDRECGADGELRQRVEALLQAHDGPAGFLDKPPVPVSSTVDEPRRIEGPGSRIGPYKLLQQIGEGGMGVVFLAEQIEPVQRKVALKVIKPGMDTHHVVARFEAERQALARMDHPNIASDPKTPIGEILKAAGTEGILLESEDQGPYALIPLDDDLIDCLVERSPKFRADCREIRVRMDAGQSQTHADVRRRLADE